MYIGLRTCIFQSYLFEFYSISDCELLAVIDMPPYHLTHITQNLQGLLQELLIAVLRGICVENRIGIKSNVKIRKGR